MLETTTDHSGSSTRRGMIAGAALAAGAALIAPQAAKAAVSPPLTYAGIPGTGDIKVLNYALALEALEADLYQQAYFRLTTGTTNALGITIPGLGLSRKELDVRYVREFAGVEEFHRDFLNKNLGSASILASAPFATAKFDFGLQNFSRKQVLNLLYIVEGTGVGAYLGAIPRLASKTYLQTAGAIQGTEARHTATMAIILNTYYNSGNPTAPLYTTNNGIDAAIEPDTVLAAVSPYIVLGS